MPNIFDTFSVAVLKLYGPGFIFDYATLDDNDAFVVCALLRYIRACRGTVDSTAFVIDFAKFMPTDTLGRQLCLHLNKLGVITPVEVPASCNDIEICKLSDWAMGELCWRMASDEMRLSPSELLISLEDRLLNLEAASIKALWMTIGQAECERYLAELSIRYGFAVNSVLSDKTKEALTYCLVRLSVPKTWNILWCVMRDVAALMQTGTYTKLHLCHMVSFRIVSEVNRRITNFKMIKPWSRQAKNLESTATTLFIDDVLSRKSMEFETICAQDFYAL